MEGAVCAPWRYYCMYSIKKNIFFMNYAGLTLDISGSTMYIAISILSEADREKGTRRFCRVLSLKQEETL